MLHIIFKVLAIWFATGLAVSAAISYMLTWMKKH